jgi:hypothetical protein
MTGTARGLGDDFGKTSAALKGQQSLQIAYWLQYKGWWL